jgi:signal transduction histidine kinase
MRSRIRALTVGLTVLVVLAFAVPIAFLIRSTVEQRALRAASDEVASVAVFLRNSSPTDAEITSYLASIAKRSERRTSVRTPSGRDLGELPPSGSPDPVAAMTAGTPPPSGPDGNHGGGPGHGGGGGKPSDQVSDPVLSSTTGGQIAGLVVSSGTGNYEIRSYVPAASYQSRIHRWWLLLAAASVGLLLVSLLAAELVSARLVRPLLRAADTANRLSLGDRTARAPEQGPSEVAAVGAALNRLADRIESLITEERETVAELSHRLRTPLTALRLDVDSLADRDEAARLGEHVSALERTLTAIINAARRPQREGIAPLCDATAVIAARLAFWLPLAEDQQRPVRASMPDRPLPVRAGAEDLAAAVDALFENVVAHTPEGATIGVTLVAGPGDQAGAVLDIDDAGPGLLAPPTPRGQSDRGSSGLGLSIARRCAEASGGNLRLGPSPLGGLQVRLTLGRP